MAASVLAFLDVFRRPAIAGRIGEVCAVIGEHRVDAARHSGSEVAQQVRGDPTGGFFVQLEEGELRGPVDRDQQVELALLGSHLGQIDVEVPMGYAFHFARTGLSPSTSGNRLMPWCFRQRCGEARVRCGIVA